MEKKNVMAEEMEEVVVNEVINEAANEEVAEIVEKPIKKVTKPTAEKKEVVRVEMPQKNEEGKYGEDSVFSKEQFAQMLADAGMEKRSAVGQSSMFYKGDTPDTKVYRDWETDRKSVV